MNTEKRKAVKEQVLKRHELYKLQQSRFKRILKDPIRTIPFFIMAYFAYKHPFNVNYKTFWGDRMSFYLPEGNAIYYYGFFEANLTNFFLNFLNEGDVFFDIGAHVGYYSMLGSSLVGETGEVHSFEPTPRTFETLKKNIEIKQNIQVNNCGVLDHETEIEFIDYGPKHSVFNSFKERTNAEMSFLSVPQKIKIKTISLDKYCQQKNIYPDFIKIDAEGAEHLILQSMTDLLKDKKPVITIEVGGDDEWKDNCSKSIELLERNGYIAYEITLEGNLQKHTQKESYSYDNLLFAHPDKIQRIQPFII